MHLKDLCMTVKSLLLFQVLLGSVIRSLRNCWQSNSRLYPKLPVTPRGCAMVYHRKPWLFAQLQVQLPREVWEKVIGQSFALHALWVQILGVSGQLESSPSEEHLLRGELQVWFSTHQKLVLKLPKSSLQACMLHGGTWDKEFFWHD